MRLRRGKYTLLSLIDTSPKWYYIVIIEKGVFTIFGHLNGQHKMNCYIEYVGVREDLREMTKKRFTSVVLVPSRTFVYIDDEEGFKC